MIKFTENVYSVQKLNDFIHFTELIRQILFNENKCMSISNDIFS